MLVHTFAADVFDSIIITSYCSSPHAQLFSEACADLKLYYFFLLKLSICSTCFCCYVALLIILIFLTAPFCFFLAFSYFDQVFITLIPDHWCHVPQFNSSQLSLHQR